MAYVSTGLPNQGKTTYYKVEYDSTLSTADGQDRALALMAVIDADYDLMNGWFGNIGLPDFASPILVQIGTGGPWFASWPPVIVHPGNGSPLDLVRFLVVSEVSEMFMYQQQRNINDPANLGWWGNFNEGAMGEGLSHFLATQLLISIGSIYRYSSLSSLWLNSPRADSINNIDRTDYSNSPKSACSSLFCWYLNVQLGFSVAQIVGAAAATLTGVYQNLTGDTNDPFPYFKAMLDAAYPSMTTSSIPGPNYDNPYPLGTLSFVVAKSTYGHDEVQAALGTSSGRFPNALQLTLDGFNSQSLGAAMPALSGAAVFSGLTWPPDATGVQYQSANHLIPQRITFPYDALFTSAALTHFPASGTSQKELDGTITLAGKAFNASTQLTFEAAGYPFFTNVDPAANNVFWLSQDLRVFTATPGLNTHPVGGGPAFTNDSFTGAYDYIQALLTFLNSTYGNPSGVDPFASGSGILPNQGSAYTADSSVTPTTSGHNNYNFAVARVRLTGSSGQPGQTDNVRVFFRVWGTQTADTDYQTSTTYRSHLDAAGLPDYPLLGSAAHTIPFFATGNSPNLTDPNNLEYGPNGANNRSLVIATGGSLWAYYGCFVNVYDANNLVNGAPVQQALPGDHHCIVAQIAYDGAPINGTPGPETSDKLAQRNLQVTHSGNPGFPATHRVPQTFDLRRSPNVPARADLLGHPDELLIIWGATPKGTSAQIFWPGANAAEIVALASRLYGPHQLSVVDAETIRCEVDGAITYVPIPHHGPADLSGLLTLDMPTTVTYGQEFNVVVRRTTTRQPDRAELPKAQALGELPPEKTYEKTYERAPEAVPAKAGKGPSGYTESLPLPTQEVKPPSRRAPSWRYVVGTFQVRIPVTPEDKMLPAQEDALAIFKWRLEHLSHTNRWYRVLQRYVGYLADKVDALGGHSKDIPPSLAGAPHELGGRRRHAEHTGKIDGIHYDRFGDFAGFTLRLEDGHERSFRARERAIEELVRTAWRERYTVSVYADRDSDWMASLILRRP
jgi:hypothetical protein